MQCVNNCIFPPEFFSPKVFLSSSKNKRQIKMGKYFVLVFVLLLVLGCLEASLLIRRSIAENAESNKKSEEICIKNAPCGWAVYTRYTRVVDYFMKNICDCPPDKKCIRTDDDISVAAFVYRCRDSSNPKDVDTNS